MDVITVALLLEEEANERMLFEGFVREGEHERKEEGARYFFHFTRYLMDDENTF